MISWIGSPNYTKGRQGKKVEKIVLHWIVGKLAAADITFQNKTRGTSAHYAIGGEEVHQYVKEEDTAYHAGDWDVNTRTIGIEHEGGPNLAITEATYKTSGYLVSQIVRRYNIPLDRAHIIGHKEVKSTQCPGSLDIDRVISEAKKYFVPQPEPPQTGGETMNKEQLIIDAYYALTGEYPTEAEKQSRLKENLNTVDLLKSLTGDGRFKKKFTTSVEVVKEPTFSNSIATAIWNTIKGYRI